MILDAGCGNRCMWKQKDNPNIVFIDIEKQLQRKPNLFASNIALPFRGGEFDTIFFDPPFKWNCDDHPFFSFPNTDMLYAMYPDISKRSQASYYGIERYKTREALVAYLFKAEQELHRILKPDGILWLRWCSMTSMTEKHVLNIFHNWDNCTTHQIDSNRRSTGSTNSFWFMLMKKSVN